MRAVLIGLATAGILTLTGSSVVLASGGGHNSGATKTCSISSAVLGGPMSVSGTGYTAGAKYTIVMTWPYGGQGDLFATADSTGSWVTNTYAYWSGSYYAKVLNSKGSTLATCSQTVS